MKNTPGPWAVFQPFPVGESWPGVEAEGLLSVVVYGHDPDDDGGVRGRSHAEAVANAILIASAPALADALEQIAIPTLRYCEEKFGLDDQARVNLEAALRAAQPPPVETKP